MSTEPELDRYFTEQVVGHPFVITLGENSAPRQPSRHGLLVDWAHDRMRLTRRAARSLVARDPLSVLGGEPLALEALRPLRWKLVLAAWLLWSLLLVAACVYFLGGLR